METDATSEAVTGEQPRSPSRRPDVISARSRMRTKYGSQRQIADVTELLTDDEELLHLAVTSGRPQPGRHTPGLLALTDRRMLFAPHGGDPASCVAALDEVEALYWVSAGRTGSLGVRTADFTRSFQGVTTADARDLVGAIQAIRPSIRCTTSA